MPSWPQEASSLSWSVTQVISTHWNFFIKYFKSQQQKWNFREKTLQNYHLHVIGSNFYKFWSCWFINLINQMVDSGCLIIICLVGVNAYPHLYTETKFTSFDSIYDNLTSIYVRKVYFCNRIRINSFNEFNKGLYLNIDIFCALMQFWYHKCYDLTIFGIFYFNFLSASRGI